MKLSEILAISGQQGLFKFVAQAKNGIIVESLIDNKRMLVQGSSKVSALGDIAIFTEGEDMPLAEVFENILKGCDNKQAISHKEEDAKLKKEFERFLPQYDKERVRVSDIKKVFAWYNILTAAGFATFIEKEEEAIVEEEAKEEKKPAKKAAAPKTAAKKPATTATPKSSAKTSAAKVTKVKTAPKAK